MKTIDVNLVFIKTILKVNSMKHVCHCYDGFVREYKYIQRPQIDPNEAIVYYGQLDDIVLCQLSKNLDITDIKLKNQILYKKLHPEL